MRQRAWLALFLCGRRFLVTMTWNELLAVYRHALRLAALGDLEAEAWTSEFQLAVGLEDLKVRQARLRELEASASRAWLHPADPQDLAAEP